MNAREGRKNPEKRCSRRRADDRSPAGPVNPRRSALHAACRVAFVCAGIGAVVVSCVLLAACRTEEPPLAGSAADRLPRPSAFEEPLRGAFEEGLERLRSTPSNAAAWGRLGMLLAAHGVHEAARIAYAEAAALAPEDHRWHHLLAVVCDALALRDEAAVSFARAIECRPDDVAAVCSLARLREAGGDFDAAAKLYGKALEERPTCVAALVGLARNDLRRGRENGAERRFEEALDILPRCGPAHAGLARIHARRGDDERTRFHRAWSRVAPGRAPVADPLMDEVLAFSLVYSARVKRGEVAGAAGDFARAATEFRAAARLRADLAEPRYYLGITLPHLDDLGGALRELREATRLDRSHVDSWLQLARLLTEQGDVTAAHEALGAGLAATPGSAALLAGRARLHFHERRDELALADCEAAIALEPGYAPAHLQKGVILFTQAAGTSAPRLVAALAAFEKALELQADLAAAYEFAGLAAWRLFRESPRASERADRLARAIRRFSELARYFPERKSAHAYLIRALAAAGDDAAVERARARARRRWPDDDRFR